MATAATALGSSELILLPAIVLPVWIALLCFAVVLVQKNEAEQKEVTEVRWVVGGTVRWADIFPVLPSFSPCLLAFRLLLNGYHSQDAITLRSITTVPQHPKNENDDDNSNEQRPF